MFVLLFIFNRVVNIKNNNSSLLTRALVIEVTHKQVLNIESVDMYKMIALHFN